MKTLHFLSVLCLAAALAACRGGDSTKAKTAPLANADISIDSSDIAAPDALAFELLPPSDIAPDTATAICPGGNSCPCTASTDCDSGLCADTPTGKRCAAPCLSAGTCDPGFECTLYSLGSDSGQFCLARFPHLCDPCAANSDCDTIGHPGARCVDRGELGRFCGSACQASADCPAGYQCIASLTVDGTSEKQCVLPGSKECACSVAAEGKSTTCFAAKAIGPGKTASCQGTRACKFGTLQECAASEPSAEVCDGKDNDCNGKTDDEACSGDGPCVKGICNGGNGLPYACTMTALADGSACEDGDVCTEKDKCVGGLCQSGLAKECSTSNPCESGSCDSKLGCVFANLDGKACEDGNFCTQYDQCQNGACKSGALKTCTNTNPCQQKPLCEPESGKCVGTNLAAGTPCNDGTLCTEGDACSGGACSGLPVNCNDDNACTGDSCDPDTGCAHLPIAATCSDGDACTQKDACKDGQCSGQALSCDDENGCTTDSCDKTAGCQHVTNSLACDDENACTTGDTCGGGACVLASAVTCVDGNTCTDDGCDKASGCTFNANEKPCNDGSLCTVGDACSGSACQAGSAEDCDDGNGCTVDSCDAASGCVHSAASGTPCEDGSKCTAGDLCQDTVCAGTALVCDDKNACTVDSCDSQKGCTTSPEAEIACDDGSKCTDGDTCKGGYCLGTTVSCDDQDVCTSDSCDDASGCKHFPLTDPTCDDGNACTQDDKCADGKCKGGASVCACGSDGDCPNDGNLCNGTMFCDKATFPYACQVKAGTVVTCDSGADTACKVAQCHATTGTCALVALTDGKDCSDGSACTSGDACAGGVCVGGGAVSCDDSNPCTFDSCDSIKGCERTANEGLACDADGSVCTVNDKCVGMVCTAGINIVCNDANLCTDDSCDATAGCLASATTATCDDSNACTENDTCADSTCKAGADLTCSDGNACTDDGCAPASGCTHAESNCDDKDLCTDDACNPASGCVHLQNAVTVCDDGDVCTSADACVAGTCTGGAAIDCNDHNVCTSDLCDAKSGCFHANLPGQVGGCYPADLATKDVGICHAGTASCDADGVLGDCNGAVVPASAETCGDKLDNTCNGQTDEGCKAVSFTLRFASAHMGPTGSKGVSLQVGASSVAGVATGTKTAWFGWLAFASGSVK